MTQPVIAILRTLFSVLIAAWLAYYLATHWDIFRDSLDASPGQLGLLAACVLITWVLNSLQVLFLLRLEGVRPGFWENILVQCGTQLGNYIPMRIGTVLRFRYFKKLHGLEYTRFGGIAGVRLVILVTAAGLLGTTGMLGFSLVDGRAVNGILWVLFSGMIAIPLVAWYISVRHLSLPEGRAGEFLKKFLSGFLSIRAQPRIAVFVLLLLLGQFAALWVRLYVSFAVLQVELSPWVLVMLAPMTTLFAFLTITPGNLGLREWLIGVMSVAAGYQFEGAVFAGVVDRAVLMGCTFFFGAFGLAFLLIRLRNAHSISAGENTSAMKSESVKVSHER